MTHPDDDVLAALALDEPVPPAAAEHARSCPACSATLAALRASLATLRSGAPELVPPPRSVWDAVESEIDGGLAGTSRSTDAPPSPAPAGPGAPATTPPTASPAEQSGDELARRRDRRTARRGIPLAWVAGAAAAGMVVGVVGTRALTSERTPDPVVLASTSLDTLDTRQARGTADVVREAGQLDLDVDTTAFDPGQGYFEVWLINRDLKRMVSVGVLRPQDGHQRFAIDQALIDQGYVIVDVSREGFDDKPQHSGDSVVRGTLAL